MKKILLFAMTLAFAFPVLADLNGNGYYRVQNAYTKRWTYLRDNTGSLNKATTSADVAALKLYAEHEATLSDPSTVFYFSKASTGDSKYDIGGQGTSIHSIIDLYLDIQQVRKPYEDKNCYYMYGSLSGMVRYLGDTWKDMTDPEGMASVDATGDDRKWYINPLDADSDEYFGVKPSVEAQGKYYHPMYAAFPFSAKSEGMKFYTISEIDARGAVIIKEITGTVPASTPVIIECSHTAVSDNRLNVGGTPEEGVASGNLLKGVYFDNPSKTHYNRTPFNKETMRVLGVKDGKLAFVKSDIEFLPANQAYLQLTDPTQYATDAFILMTPEERDEAFKDPDPGTMTPDDPDPENPDNKDPDNPDNPDPENPDNQDPDNPDNPDPENPDNQDPDNPDNPDPENPDNQDPENPDNKDPENPDNQDPDNPSDPGSVTSIPMSSTVCVYSLDGRLLKGAILKEEVPSLGKGLYFIRSGSVAEKIIIR